MTGSQYISALAAYIRTHEASLAAYNRPTAPPLPPASFSNLSWTTLLTLGAISTPSASAQPAIPQTILKLDPHHLYYLLLKFEEIGIDGIGSLDSQIELPIGVATLTRPLSYAQDDREDGKVVEKRRDSDAASTMSAFSSSLSSLGSNWWTSTAPSTERIDKNRRILDEGTQVKFIYSAFTKLPAITLSPFVFPSTSSLRPSTPLAPLTRPIEGFLDLPPPLISIPLSPFKNLRSLSLLDLSPRSFYGWDLLSFGLRSLEVRNAGIADAGELIWELPSEDFIRRNRQRGEARRNRDRFAYSEEERTEEEDTPPPLPPHAWHSLTHLSLANNSLTFIPSAPLATLARLTSIDLSSNLLIAVPAGLAALKFLRSINLSDNMIENLAGISTALPSIRVINLSKNRLENLSGLDRLSTLERIDLRENRIKESGEIGRLAVLPMLREVYVLVNPFSLPVVAGGGGGGGEGMGEEGYRLKIFNYFIAERASSPTASMIKIDGHGPTSSERRALILPPEWNDTSSYAAGRRSSSLGSMGGSWGRQSITRNEEAVERSGVGQKVVGSGGRRVVTSPNLFVPISKETILEESTAAATGKMGTTTTVEKGKERKKSKAHKHKPKRIVDLDAPSSSTHRTTKAPSSTNSSHPTRAGNGGSESSSGETTSGTPVGSPPLLFHPHPRQPLGSIGRVGSHRSTKDSSRQSLSANTFDDPSTSGSAGGQGEGGGASEAFRRKIEALRNEVGDSYLAVLGERELVAEEESKRRNSKGM